MGGRILVCLTCNRYGAQQAGQPTPGHRLAGALKAQADALGHQVTVRTVECLNGCPRPCTAALRMPGRCIIRFSGLTPEDAPALIEVAEQYSASATGDIPPEAMPAGLRNKVSLRVASLNQG
jgi:predicted metal-binding protein